MLVLMKSVKPDGADEATSQPFSVQEKETKKPRRKEQRHLDRLLETNEVAPGPLEREGCAIDRGEVA